MKTNQHKMKIDRKVFYSMIDFIGGNPAESGGFLFGDEQTSVITKFIPDTDAKTSRSTYTISDKFINPLIKKLWDNEGLSLLGIVHSHPNGYGSLSSPDLEYFRDLLKYVKRDNFYAPIVFTIPDGGLDIFPYVFHKGSPTPVPADTEILPENYQQSNDNQETQRSATTDHNTLIRVPRNTGQNVTFWINSINQMLPTIVKILGIGALVYLTFSALPALSMFIKSILVP